MTGGESFRLPPKCILKDGSSRRCIRLAEANKKLKEANSVIKGLTGELGAMRAQYTVMEATLQRYKNFLGNIVHELRTPLQYILGFSKVMMMKFEKFGAKEDLEITKGIHSNAIFARENLTDIQFTTENTTRDLLLETHDISQLATEIFNFFRERGKITQYTCQFGLLAKYDTRPIRIALINLIKNSIKYSQHGVPLKIEFGYDIEKKAFYVRDNGIGFDPKEADKLFIRGSRLSSSAGYEGTGIGLTMVKDAIDLHCGEVWGFSEGVGKGATFYFSLPQNT
jgi:signal transduction histidine kinase